MNSPLRVAFETLGCRSNYADTVDLAGALVGYGAVPCETIEDADVCVINTCSVTDGADKEAYRLIRRARSKSPNARIVVTGCLAEIGEEELRATGMVDAVVGPGKKEEVLKAIISGSSEVHDKKTRRDLRERRSISLTDPISENIAGPGNSLGEIRTRARYHLRIQEGCENSCTFCIIPQTRGSLSSRSIEEILRDFSHLHSVGYNEVVLTGTHIGGYGEDIGSSLYELLKRLSLESPIRRIRLSSIDPNDVSPQIIDLIAENHLFCSHLHICVQAFSDSVLKRMNRRYRLAEVFDTLDYIKEKLPNCCIGSDLITGFPGESREEVEQGVELFLSLPISYLHVFPYSEREGTAAVRLDGEVPLNERKRRAARWRAISVRKKRDFMCGLLGRELETVIETSEYPYLFGTSREYAAVKIPFATIVSETAEARALIGKTVTLTAKRYDQLDEKVVCE